MQERQAYARTTKMKRCLTPEIFKHYQDSKYYYFGSMLINAQDSILNKNVHGLHKTCKRKPARKFCFTPDDDIILAKILQKMEQSPRILPYQKQMLYCISGMDQSNEKQFQTIKLRKGHRKLDLIPGKSPNDKQLNLDEFLYEKIQPRCYSETKYSSQVINYQECSPKGSQYQIGQSILVSNQQSISLESKDLQNSLITNQLQVSNDIEEEKCEQSVELVQLLKEKRQRHGRKQGVLQIESSKEKEGPGMNGILNIQQKSRVNNKLPQLSKKLETIQENEEL